MKTIDFKIYYKHEEISGYIYLDEADDETPFRFYDRINQEQWNIPENPHKNPISELDQIKEVDYDFLVWAFATTDIIQYLVDFADENKTIVIREDDENNKVYLVINGGDD